MIIRYPFCFHRNCRCNQFRSAPADPGHVTECEIKNLNQNIIHTPETLRAEAIIHTPETLRAEAKELPEQNGIFIKSTSLGGIMIPDNIEKGTIYKIASVNVKASCFRRYLINLCFTCNIATTNARINLSFQIFKQGYFQLVSVPVSCNYSYIRNSDSTEINAFSFIACDCDSLRYNCCNYNVCAEIIGESSVGITSIANANLAVMVFDNSCGCC